MRFDPNSSNVTTALQKVADLPPGKVWTRERYATTAVWFPQVGSTPQPYENKVYVFGGIHSGNDSGNEAKYLGDIVIFDPKTNNVTLKSDLVDRIQGMSSVFAAWSDIFASDADCPQGCIYLFGGQLDRAVDPEVAMIRRITPSTEGGSIKIDIKNAGPTLMKGLVGTSAIWAPPLVQLPDLPTELPSNLGRTIRKECIYGCAYIGGGFPSENPPGAPFASKVVQLFDPQSQRQRTDEFPVHTFTARFAASSIWIADDGNPATTYDGKGYFFGGLNANFTASQCQVTDCFLKDIVPLVPGR